MKKLFCGMFTLAVFIAACGKKDDTAPVIPTVPTVDGKDSIPVIEKGLLIKTITEGSITQTYEYDVNNKLTKSTNGSQSPSTYNYTYTNGLLTKITETNVGSGFNNMSIYGMVYNGSTLSKILRYDLVQYNPDNKTNEPAYVDSITYYANNKIKALYTFSGYGPRTLVTADSAIWDSKGNIEKILFYGTPNNKGLELFSTITYTYDDKKNPLAENPGALFMAGVGYGFELIKFSTNNPLTATTTYVSGNSVATRAYTYEYNTLGYPTKTTVAEKMNGNEHARIYTIGYYN